MKNLKSFLIDNNSYSTVSIGQVKIGNGYFMLSSGPCAVENETMMTDITAVLKSTHINVLRGGAYKPRTSPYSFQGLGDEGLRLLKQASDSLGIPFVTEATDINNLEIVAEIADAIQIGSRNMNSFELLKLAGRINKPVILKRGMAATVEEFLYAAEYILNEGNDNVILCERGIRSFDNTFRNIVDFNSVTWLKKHTRLPVIVDPSHGSGRIESIIPLSLAAIAVGADGIMVESHPAPEYALSDGHQSLSPDQFREWEHKVTELLTFFGKTINK